MCRVACALLTTPISYYKQIYLSTTKGAYNIGVDIILKRAIIYASGMRGIYYTRFAQFVNQNFPIF